MALGGLLWLFGPHLRESVGELEWGSLAGCRGGQDGEDGTLVCTSVAVSSRTYWVFLPVPATNFKKTLGGHMGGAVG